jgi:trimethylamine monooxygenase
MQDRFFTFTLFDAQAWWIRDVILGRIKLPSEDDMVADSESIVATEENLGDLNSQILFQAEYLKSLIADTDYPKFDIALATKNFQKWWKSKQENIVGCRDLAFVSAVDGTMGLLPMSEWTDSGKNNNSLPIANDVYSDSGGNYINYDNNGDDGSSRNYDGDYHDELNSGY